MSFSWVILNAIAFLYSLPEAHLAGAALCNWSTLLAQVVLMS